MHESESSYMVKTETKY